MSPLRPQPVFFAPGHKRGRVHEVREEDRGEAALIAGLGLLMMTFLAPFAEFYVYPKLVLRGNIEQTVLNIQANSAGPASAARN